eukprot:scaffold439_cov415-Prasinococcus_capsulatus_cf.AAC.44
MPRRASAPSARTQREASAEQHPKAAARAQCAGGAGEPGGRSTPSFGPSRACACACACASLAVERDGGASAAAPREAAEGAAGAGAATCRTFGGRPGDDDGQDRQGRQGALMPDPRLISPYPRSGRPARPVSAPVRHLRVSAQANSP